MLAMLVLTSKPTKQLTTNSIWSSDKYNSHLINQYDNTVTITSVNNMVIKHHEMNETNNEVFPLRTNITNNNNICWLKWNNEIKYKTKKKKKKEIKYNI